MENKEGKEIQVAIQVVEEGGGPHEHNSTAKKVEDLPENIAGEVAPPQPETLKTKSKRVAALDAFRGLTIVMMILVDDAGGAYEKINHSPWNGCTLADFVMPFFLFIVGVAIAFALKRVPRVVDAIRKITIRTLKLVFWGILLQGGYSHAPDDLSYGVDMKQIRWMGILQRIALVYFVVALIETVTTKLRPTVLLSGRFAIFEAYRWQWLGGFIAFIIYITTTYSLYVPDWSYVFHSPGDENDGKRFTVPCGVRGHLGPPCNAVGYVDRQVWGINHLYSQPEWIRSKDCTYDSPNVGPLRADAAPWCLAPFEPEGLLSSISAILSGTIGVHYGHVLIHFKLHSERLKHWVLMGFGLLVCGIILHFTTAIPINKQLYSISYVCFTAGAAGLVLSGFYILIDVLGFRTPFLFLEWIGMNAMLVFVMAAQGIFPAFVNGWYYETPNNSLVYWIQKHIFVNVWHSERSISEDSLRRYVNYASENCIQELLSASVSSRVGGDDGWKVLAMEDDVEISKRCSGSPHVFRSRWLLRSVSMQQFMTVANAIDAAKQWDSDLVEAKYIKDLDENLSIIRLLFGDASKPLFKNREFIVYERREAMDDGTLVVAVASLPKEISAGLHPKNNNSIRGLLLQSGWVVEKLDDHSCLVTYVVQLDPAGWLPKCLVNRFNTKLVMIIENLKKIAQACPANNEI